MNNSQEILKILLQYIQKNGTTEKQCLTNCDINTSFLTDWKGGRLKNPSYDKIVKLAEYLNIDLNVLFLGTTNNKQEPFDENKKEEVSEKINVQSDNITVKDEVYAELSKIITSLPLRERSKLIAMIYDCEEQYRKYGSMQMPQATDLPASERQLLETFRQFNDYEQAKVLERIKEWLDVKHRREQINKQKIVGIQIARRNDGTSSGQMPLTAEEAEKIAELPEETNF